MELIGTIIGYGLVAVIVIIMLVVAFNFFVALLPIIIIVLVLGVILFILDKIFGFTEGSAATLESINGIIYVMSSII